MQVNRIIDNIRPDRQTVMFSATFPRQMEALARKILQKPIEIQVGGRSVVCKDVEQHVVCTVHSLLINVLELNSYTAVAQRLQFVFTIQSVLSMVQPKIRTELCLILAILL